MDNPISSEAETRKPETGHLRVIVAVPGEPDGSGLPVAVREALAVRELGVQVRLFYLRSRMSPVRLMRDSFRLRREIREFRPHLIHAQFGTVTSFFCAINTRVPLVITFRGSDLYGDADTSPIRAGLSKLLSQLSALAATKMICVSSELRNRLWWRREQAVVLCSGTDLELFSPQPQDRARAILGWDPNQPVVAFAGRERPRVKGLQLVQDAVRVAERQTGPIRLEFLQVPFSMMPCCLNAADCLAVGSLTEGSPNIVKEALACNLPIVSTAVGDVPERLEHVDPSAVVRRDPNEFGEALAQILLHKRRSNGRQRSGLMTNDEVTSAIVSIYRAALTERGGMQSRLETHAAS